jgi:microcystin-dependent protein
VIGNLYGGVSGSTFAVPDLRGRFIRGLDGGANVDSGRTIGSTQDDSLQQHGHNMYEGDGGGAGRSPTTRSDDDNGLRYINGGLSGEVYVREIARGSMDGNIARVSGETRPKNVALLPCIRFR